MSNTPISTAIQSAMKSKTTGKISLGLVLIGLNAASITNANAGVLFDYFQVQADAVKAVFGKQGAVIQDAGWNQFKGALNDFDIISTAVNGMDLANNKSALTSKVDYLFSGVGENIGIYDSGLISTGKVLSDISLAIGKTEDYIDLASVPKELVSSVKEISKNVNNIAAALQDIAKYNPSGINKLVSILQPSVDGDEFIKQYFENNAGLRKALGDSFEISNLGTTAYKEAIGKILAASLIKGVEADFNQYKEAGGLGKKLMVQDMLVLEWKRQNPEEKISNELDVYKYENGWFSLETLKKEKIDPVQRDSKLFLALEQPSVVSSYDLKQEQLRLEKKTAELVAQQEERSRQQEWSTNTMQNQLSAITVGGTSHIGSAVYFTGRSPSVDSVRENRHTVAHLQTVREASQYTNGFIIKAPVDIVLRWGANPSDLDSHLTGPASANPMDATRFHTYYAAPGNLNAAPGALLYRDVTTGLGPEQTRINTVLPGVYRFYVHDFTNGGATNSTALSNSGAVVTLHQSGSLTLPQGQNLGSQVAAIPVPTNQVGTVWQAFELDTRTGILNRTTTFSNVSNPTSVPFNQ